MNWPRLLEIIAMALARTGIEKKVDRGWNWQCYCVVCVELRRLAA
jgi:hypothetical protein